MYKGEMMKKTLIKIIILLAGVFILYSCNDPIFFIVHEEIPILKPFIDGSPTNFVEYNGKLYVASGKQIFSYSDNKWSKWEKLGDYVGCLASAGTSLYVQYLDGSNGKIRRYNGGASNDLSISDVQSIYAAGNILFIGIRNNDKYTIRYIEDSSPGTIKSITGIDSTSMLYGAAYDGTYYYLCTNSGIFCVDSTFSAQSDVLGKDYDFTGIIELKNNYVAAITNDGKLYEIENAVIKEVAKFSDDRYASGALALWYRYKDDTMPSLLLVGRKEMYYSTSSSYTNGYVEIALDTNTGSISGTEFSEPGKNTPSSIDNYERYVSSLGKKPVNHIIQAPAAIDPKMTLFASTQQNGVWSYKDRDDGKGEQWNAEQ